MTTHKHLRFSLSLMQAISVTFLTVVALVIALSGSSFKGMMHIGEQLEQLSHKELPGAMDNAKLTRSVLETVKLLNY